MEKRLFLTILSLTFAVIHAQEFHTGAKGGLTSPNYPYYNNNENKTYIISVADDKIIKIVFSLIKIETSDLCKNDYIKIVDKDGTELLPKTCGLVNLPPVITSFNDWVQVIFRTNANTRQLGWKLNWTEEMRSVQGVFTSPNYPNSYKNNLNTNYGIQVTQGSVIEILFSEFMLDNNTPCTDFIQVLDGNDKNILLDSTCGSKLPARILSVTPRVNIFFHSDHSSPNGYKRRWMLTWNKIVFAELSVTLGQEEEDERPVQMKVGEQGILSCETPSENIAFCEFVDPSGKNWKLAPGLNHGDERLSYDGDDFTKGCRLKFNTIQSRDSGIWRCKITGYSATGDAPIGSNTFAVCVTNSFDQCSTLTTPGNRNQPGKSTIIGKGSLPLPVILGCSLGGVCLLVVCLSVPVCLCVRRRRRAAEAAMMEENTDLNDVYGTYGECGETDYSTVEDTNMDYEATE